MGLWDAGKVNFVTAGIILAVCKQAYEDHKGGEEFTGPLRAPEDMHVNELVELDASKGDGNFDRCSHAKHTNELFKLNGSPCRITQYTGSWWVEYLEPIGNDRPFKFDDATLADVLTKQNGPHPNPYVARIEVSYASVARAGYGIRKDGTFDLWYD